MSASYTKLSSRARETDLSYKVSDWMRTVTSPTPYRVGTYSFHLNTYRIAKFGVIMLLFLTALVLVIPVIFYRPNSLPIRYRHIPLYNKTYPLTSPTFNDDEIKFRIAVITDLDTNSKIKNEKKWISYMMYGFLICNQDFTKFSLKWDASKISLSSELSHKERGMELSELIVFNGKLYTCDDRTGIVFEITNFGAKTIPFVVLQDGDGIQEKGFKCEWMAVKDEELWVGGLGKEWTSIKGIYVNDHPQWVKSIGHLGDVRHHNWVDNYNNMREKTGYQIPGYMIHESVVWSDFHKSWFFLPRRASTETYSEEQDERRATNILLKISPCFSMIEVSHVGKLHLTHGFSSFKFIPGTQDQLIVALKTEEDQGKIASYIIVFNLKGDILMDELKIGDHKFEGIEFV